jgi:hypothetical protein
MRCCCQPVVRQNGDLLSNQADELIYPDLISPVFSV